MKLESGDYGSHPDTRKAPRLGALGGGGTIHAWQASRVSSDSPNVAGVIH